MKTQVRPIAEMAAALAAQPSSLDAWWALSAALADSGPRKRAARSYSELGKAASRLGSVGLAVACAIRLREIGAKGAAALVSQIADRHASGKRARGRPTAPPMAPPAEAEAAAEIPEERREALELAARAVDKAVASAVEREPSSLPPQHLASSLTAGDFRGLVEAATLRRYDAGETIIEQGLAADTLYWVARGVARAVRGELLLGELPSNAFFGEIALLSGATRTVTVVAGEPTWLLEIPAAQLETLASSSPELATVLARYARSRLLSTLMQTSPLFTRLSAQERGQLLAEFEPRVADEGTAVITNGAENQHLFVVVSGACEVRRGDEVVSTLVCGDAVGEKSLLSRQEAQADVVAIERTVLLALPRDKFDAVAVRHPEMLAEVYRLVVEREKEEIIHDASTLVI